MRKLWVFEPALKDFLFFHGPNQGNYPANKRPAQEQIQGKDGARIRSFLVKCDGKGQKIKEGEQGKQYGE